MRCRSLILALLTLSLLPALGQAQQAVYVHAGHLLDVDGGQWLVDHAILIRGQRIESVAPASELERPSDAEFLDLRDAWVLPGLVDLHTHLTGGPQLHGYQGLSYSTPRLALLGAAHAKQTLEAGFTTVRNVGAGGYTDVALRDAIRAGDVPGPRLQVSGPALGITGGHCDSNLLPPEINEPAAGVADGPWAVRAKVREVIKFGADVIKVCATGGVLSKGTSVGAQQYTLEEMQAIVEEAHRRGRKVAAHAHGTEGIKAAIRAGVDSVEHASLIDDEGIRLARENGTYLVLDIYVSTYILGEGEAAGILPESLEKERIVGQAQRDSFRRAHAAGVQVGYGTDAGVYPHGGNAKQFAYMVEYGMTPLEAIRSATIEAASLMGWEDRIGSLDPGKLADLIAVGADPLNDVTVLEKVDFVMKDGQVFKDKR